MWLGTCKSKCLPTFFGICLRFDVNYPRKESEKTNYLLINMHEKYLL